MPVTIAQHGALFGMKIDEREDFVDVVAQAVIDKIEERDRVNGLVEMVVAKVLAMQKAEADLKAAAEAEASDTGATDTDSDAADTTTAPE